MLKEKGSALYESFSISFNCLSAFPFRVFKVEMFINKTIDNLEKGNDKKYVVKSYYQNC